MKLLPILILSLLLVSVSSAKQESLTMGPYKVSFDLNTTQKYEINNTVVKYGETYGGINYAQYIAEINGIDLAGISITFYAGKMSATTESDMENNFRGSSFNDDIRIYDRIIDDQPALLGTRILNGRTEFIAEYSTKFNESEDTEISLISFLPNLPKSSGAQV